MSIIGRLGLVSNVSEPLYYYRRRKNNSSASQRTDFEEACLASRKQAVKITNEEFKPLAYAALLSHVLNQFAPYLYGKKRVDEFFSSLLREIGKTPKDPLANLAFEYLGEAKKRKLFKYTYITKFASLVQKPFVMSGISAALKVRNFTSEKTRFIGRTKRSVSKYMEGMGRDIRNILYEKRFYSCLSKNNSGLRPSDLANYNIVKSPYMDCPFMNGCTALFASFNESLPKAYATWGFSYDSMKIANEAYKNHAPLFLLEDGFIRSLYSISSRNVRNQYKLGLSFTIDTKGFYFDGTRETDLEALLNNFELDKVDYSRATLLMELIKKEEITKYNFQINTLPKPLCGKDLVLVLDQSRGDQSLKFGMAKDDVFERMLFDAIRENPNSTIVFKVHPDNLVRGFLPKEALSHRRVVVLDKPVNPIALLKQCREVYVATSQMGMEALICGKKVHVYGMPFYSNWGLTEDKIQNRRRKRKLKIEELFFIAYCVYTRYIDPDLKKEGSIEGVIQKLLEQKKHLINGGGNAQFYS